MDIEAQKERQMLENEALALEKAQHMLLHVVATLSVIQDERPTEYAKKNKLRFGATETCLAEASGIIQEAQRRLGNALAIYPLPAPPPPAPAA